MANSIASIIIAALAPFLGAIADRGTAKKKLLFLFAFLGIIMPCCFLASKSGPSLLTLNS